MTDYHLRFPPDAACIYPGCTLPVGRVLNLRIRREDTGASYGANIRGAYLCAIHGDGGADINIEFNPRRDGIVRTSVTCQGSEVARMNYEMGSGHPGQDGLW